LSDASRVSALTVPLFGAALQLHCFAGLGQPMGLMGWPQIFVKPHPSPEAMFIPEQLDTLYFVGVTLNTTQTFTQL